MKNISEDIYYITNWLSLQVIIVKNNLNLCRFIIDVLQKDKKTSDEWEILCYS